MINVEDGNKTKHTLPRELSDKISLKEEITGGLLNKWVLKNVVDRLNEQFSKSIEEEEKEELTKVFTEDLSINTL